MASPGASGGEGALCAQESAPWGADWEREAMSPSELNDFHALNASTAAYHADVAAKQAASLAQWVQYLAGTLGGMQQKVTELEDWKRWALEETRRLREEHKALKHQVLAGERSGSREASPTALSSAEDPTPTKNFTDSAIAKAGKDASASTATPTPGPLSPEPVSPLARFGDLDSALKEEGVHVTTSTLDGSEYWHVEWRIGNLSAKLRGCMGRALVSSSFEAAGLRDLRLMICPDGQEVTGLRNRKFKELYAKKLAEGPLDALLKIKVPNCPAGWELELSLAVGSLRRGPFRHDFAEAAVTECGGFGDWLRQLAADRSLTVAAEVRRAPAAATGQAAAPTPPAPLATGLA